MTLLRNLVVGTVVLFGIVGAASADQPAIEGTFCTTFNETAVTDGTNRSYMKPFPMCIDSQNLAWWRVQPNNITVMFNGTDLFTIALFNGKDLSCLRKHLGPQDPKGMPWSMLLIDAGATLERKTASSEIWSNVRQTGLVEWYVAQATLGSTSVHELLMTSTVQPCQPPSSGQACSIIRDFSKDFTDVVPAGQFDPGMPCPLQPHVGTPTPWTDGVVGGF
jgi:hypothetical protein